MIRPSLAFVLLLAACGGSATPGPDVVTRDSAGVTIVETNRALWGDSMPWTVDTVPLVTIGQEDGEEPYLFEWLTGALRLDDGSIVAADLLSGQLRHFDADGVLLATAGRKGPGPSEFDRINRIARCGQDEIWVDAGSRLSVWGTDLRYRREFAVPENVARPPICFDGFGVVVQQDIGDLEQIQRRNTITYDSLHLFIRDSIGKTRHELMRIPLNPRLIVMDGKEPFGIIHPFAPRTVLAANGPSMLLGTGETLEIRVLDIDGRLVRLLRGPVEDLSITDSMLASYTEADLGVGPAKERELLQRGGVAMPATYPAYTALLTDRLGDIWARRFSVPGSNENRWGVFNPAGRFLGHVALPTGLELFEIGADYLLGKTRDSLGVEQVREYRLVKR